MQSTTLNTWYKTALRLWNDIQREMKQLYEFGFQLPSKLSKWG